MMWQVRLVPLTLNDVRAAIWRWRTKGANLLKDTLELKADAIEELAGLAERCDSTL